MIEMFTNPYFLVIAGSWVMLIGIIILLSKAVAEHIVAIRCKPLEDRITTLEAQLAGKE